MGINSSEIKKISSTLFKFSSEIKKRSTQTMLNNPIITMSSL